MESNNVNYSISCISAEFIDRNIEKDFYNCEFFNMIRYLKRFLVMLSVFMCMPVIADVILIKDPNRLWVVLGLRVIVFALVIMFYIRIKLVKPFLMVYNWIMGTEIAIILLLFLMFYLYGNLDFLMQTLNVSITLVFVFFIPNRFIYYVINSIVTSTCYIILVLLAFPDVKRVTLIYALIFIVLLIVMSSISAFRVNCYKRAQFVNEKKLSKLSVTDSLTGKYNRLKFDEELNKSIISAKRNNDPLSMILLDFDNFKLVNDRFGHLVGDKALVLISDLIGRSIREEDILSRWGGEEFSILLPRVDKEEAGDIAERLRTQIACYVIPPIGRITCSFGVASLEPGDDVVSLLRRVDKMLYKAKAKGRNIVVVS